MCSLKLNRTDTCIPTYVNALAFLTVDRDIVNGYILNNRHLLGSAQSGIHGFGRGLQCGYVDLVCFLTQFSNPASGKSHGHIAVRALAPGVVQLFAIKHQIDVIGQNCLDNLLAVFGFQFFFDGSLHLTGNIFHAQHGAFRNNALLSRSGHGHTIDGDRIAEFWMGSFHNLFQGCYDFQILCCFFNCIYMCISGQTFGFRCYCLGIHFLQFHAIGSHDGDLESFLRYYCKIQVLSLADTPAAFERSASYWIHSIVHTVHACHGLDTSQIFGSYLVGSGIGRIPDGYGVVGFSV